MDSLSKYKYEDFYKCPVCGSFVDKRNLELVLEHQHRDLKESSQPAADRHGRGKRARSTANARYTGSESW
jgi:hypothetical protein